MSKASYALGLALGFFVGGLGSYFWIKKQDLAVLPQEVVVLTNPAKSISTSSSEKNVVVVRPRKSIEKKFKENDDLVVQEKENEDEYVDSSLRTDESSAYMEEIINDDVVTKSTPQETQKWTIENAKSYLSAGTIAWSKKLPKPRSLQEEYFYLYLQIAYEDVNVQIFDLTKVASDVYHSENTEVDKFDLYVQKCLKKITRGSEQRVRNFVFRYLSAVRPMSVYPIDEDLQAYIHNPRNYTQEDIDSLKEIFLSVKYFKAKDKKRILAEANLREDE
ncbi:MAG: hypothetical protein JNL11_14250 [Bdellovibrionaceae bacterium]|nr:hypothetical protein [Pseudobdellovibrionaceae bacterium]